MFGSKNPGPSRPNVKNRDSFKVVCAALVTTLAIVEKAVDGVPAPGLKAAVGGLLEILKNAKKTRDNSQELDELNVHLKDLSDVLESIKEMNQDEFTENLSGRIAKLASDLKTVVNDYGHLRSQSATIKFFTAEDNASAISGLSKSIDRAIQTFQIGGAISVEQGIGNIQRDLRRLTTRARQDPNDPLNILQPYVADARYDSASRVKVSRCFEGTRSELLQRIYDWADDPDAKSIYWLCGLAGTGKSTIAQTVAEAFNQRKMLGASFFFSRDVAERSNPYLVFPTVAHQLGRFHKVFSSSISASVKDHPEVCTSMLETQIEKLITEPLRLIPNPPAVVAIVIDALDECSNEFLVQEMLILLAASIPQLPFRTKIFITSRPDIHIRSKFHEDVMKSVSQASLLHDIDLSIVQHDIGLYLKHHLRKIGGEMLRDITWPSQSDVDILVGRAKGLFIYASASLAYIGDPGYRHPEERLITLLADKPADSDSAPYAEIDKLYRHILQSSLPKVGKWSVASRLKPILGTIVMLFDPLPVYDMEKMIHSSKNCIVPLLNSLHAVLSVPDDPEEPIRVFHKSFPDFMLDPQRCTDSRLLIEPKIHHTQLALHCLNLMNSHLHRNMCAIQDPFIFNRDIPNLDQLLKDKVGLHVIYACRFWASHLRHADPADGTLRGTLSIFITSKLPFWLEILSLSKYLTSALDSLKMALDWFQEEKPKRLVFVRKAIPVIGTSSAIGQYLQASEGRLVQTRVPVKTLLHDCQCLLLRFSDIITRSACHIYHSALPFAPNCLLYKQFEREFENSPKALSREDGWDPALAVLKGHSGSVEFACFSPDGLRIASGSYDMNVRLWDSTTGTHIRTLEGHTSAVRSISFSPDGLRLVSGSFDETIRLWNITTGACIRTLQGHVGLVLSVCFSPDGQRLASGSSDKTVRLWDSTTGMQIRSLNEHANQINSVCFSPDGLRIASGSHDNTVRLWDTTTGAHIRTLQGHTGVWSVCFSHDGQRIASGSRDNTVYLWDSATGAHIRSLNGHSSEVSSVCFSPDGMRIVSGSHDQSIRLWATTTGAHIRTLKGYLGAVLSVCFSPDGLRVVSGSADCTARLWDSTTSAQIGSHEAHSSAVQSVGFVLDGSYICSSDEKRNKILWDFKTAKQVTAQKAEMILPGLSLPAETQSLSNPALQAESNLVLDGQSVILPSTDGKPTRVICYLPFTDVSCHVFLGNQFAAGTRGGKVHILDFSSAVAQLE